MVIVATVEWTTNGLKIRPTSIEATTGAGADSCVKEVKHHSPSNDDRGSLPFGH